MIRANHFRFYLARHTELGSASVNDTVSRVRRVENALEADAETLLTQLGVDNLTARINPDDAAFQNQNPDSLANLQVAIRRYNEFREWRTTL